MTTITNSNSVAYMLTFMNDAAALLHQARTDAHISIRGLASLANVSASTISRIESGQMDPTIGMLSRLLDSAGLEIQLTARIPSTPRLASLADAWHPSRHGDSIDWIRLRAFLDYLHQHPEVTRPALRHKPRASGSELLDNLLAGIAETQCEDLGLEPPDWTAHVARMREPWLTPGTPRIQQQARATTPPAIAVRGLTLARTSLWRERATVSN